MVLVVIDEISSLNATWNWGQMFFFIYLTHGALAGTTEDTLAGNEEKQRTVEENQLWTNEGCDQTAEIELDYRYVVKSRDIATTALDWNP